MTVKPGDIANIRGMTIENGKVNMDLEVARETILAIGAAGGALLDDANAPNYVEMDVHAAHMDAPWITITIARYGRPTAHDINKELRQELNMIYRFDNISDAGKSRIEKLFKRLGYELI